MCKGACCISLFILYWEQGIFLLEFGATLRSPSDSWGFTPNKNRSNKSVNLEGTLCPWMFLLEKYVSLFRVERILHERDLMPHIGVMVCCHVDSYVKRVHLKNITPIHVDVLFFPNTHPPFCLFLKLLVIPGRYPPGYRDFYFSRELMVLVPTNFF
jgi:hypothetical protein